MSHSFLPPSGASAWSRCALWSTMNARYPQADTRETIEGTAAHWVAAQRLVGRIYTPGQLAENGEVISDEMIDGAEMVYETIKTMCKGTVTVEQPVRIPQIHASCFGTPDYWSYDDFHLNIVDYKFGHGFVDEFWNLQGLLYALGVVNALGVFGFDVKVSFTIVQPRCYHRGEPVRTHTYELSKAYPYISQLKQAALNAYEPQPTATTNPECDHCPGRHACSALQLAAYSDAEYADARQPVELSPQAAALELRMLERALSRLQARVEGLRELTLANLKAGKRVSHYKAEPGRGRARWNQDAEKIITVGKLLGKDLSKTDVVTPNQAKKLGIDDAVISAYSVITPGATKLLPSSDDDARKVFSIAGE